MHRLLSVFALLYLVAYSSGQGAPTEGDLAAAANGATQAPPLPTSGGGGGGGGGNCRGGGGDRGGVQCNGGGGGGGRGRGSPSYSYTCRLYWCPLHYIYRRYTTSSLYRCALLCANDRNCYAWTHIPRRNLCLLYNRCSISTYCLWEAAGGFNRNRRHLD